MFQTISNHSFFFACFVASKLPTDPQLHPGSEPFGAAPCASLATLRGVAAAPWWRVTGMEWWGLGDVPPKPSKYVNMYIYIYIQLYMCIYLYIYIYISQWHCLMMFKGNTLYVYLLLLFSKLWWFESTWVWYKIILVCGCRRSFHHRQQIFSAWCNVWFPKITHF